MLTPTQFVLNTGRIHWMGEFPRPGREDLYQDKRLIGCSNEPTRIYLDLSAGLRALAFLLILMGVKIQPALPVPTSKYPRSMANEAFYYSKASPENMSGIATCRAGDTITRLLLCYKDKIKASLGRASSDGLGYAKVVDGAGLWLLVIKSADNFPRVSSLHFADPGVGEQDYLHIRWSGELEWWFSHRQC